MAKYALVNSLGLVTNMLEWDGHTDYTPENGYTVVAADDAIVIGAVCVDGVFTNPPEPVIPPTPLSFLALGKLTEVTGPSGVAMRCVVAGVSVPPAWQDYIVALRFIANGTDVTSTELPSPPLNPDGSIAYPSGT